MKGIFRAKNTKKYIGNSKNIVYRSSWELKMMMHLDKHPDVIQWASEELVIPYKSPYTGKWHRYFPDFWVKYKNKQGEIVTTVIEVKPAHECKAPKVQKKRTKKYIREVTTWGTNKSKWEAARKFCDKKGWTFQIFTERELGI
jgi:hypothetical protein